MSKSMKSNFMMLLTAFIWGSAFVAQKDASSVIPTFTFSGVRYMIAVMILVPFIMYTDKRKKAAKDYVPMTAEEKARDKRVLLYGGLSCGIVLAIASNFQQYGVAHTTSGKAAFITTLYVVIVPLLGLFLKKKVKPIIWLCVALGVLGLYMLAIEPGTFSIGKGDFLVLICAFFFATHILVIDHFSPKTDGVKLSCLQFFVAGIISLVLMFALEDVSMANIVDKAFPIFYAGAFSGGIAYTLQIVAQKDADPTIASLILSMESVFGALTGWALLNEMMTMRQFLGCVIVFTAIIIAQLPPKEELMKIGKRKNAN